MALNNPKNQTIFLDLTCNRLIQQEGQEKEKSSSTHDDAENVLYSFVDNSPSVADLLWSKKQLGQGEFLTLASETEEDMLDQNMIYPSTHEIHL
jgi:hypothetical protein